MRFTQQIKNKKKKKKNLATTAKVYQKHTTKILFTSLTAEAVSRNPLQKQLKQSKPRQVNQHSTENSGTKTTTTGQKSAAAQHAYPLFSGAAPRLERFKTTTPNSFPTLFRQTLPPSAIN